jgi:hypothetical protein
MLCIMETQTSICTCTYASCERKHKCCACLHYHRKRGELPGCYFTSAYERTYDRSITNFLRMQKKETTNS